MASTDATNQPVKGQAYRLTGFIKLVTTLEVAAAGLSTLAGSISKDGGTMGATTATPVEIATNSGFFYLDLTASEMSAQTVAIKVTATAANTEDFAIVLYPLDLTESGTRAPSQTVKKWEQYVLEMDAAGLNLDTIRRDSKTQTVYSIDGTTALYTGSVDDDGTTVTRGALA